MEKKLQKQTQLTQEANDNKPKPVIELKPSRAPHIAATQEALCEMGGVYRRGEKNLARIVQYSTSTSKRVTGITVADDIAIIDSLSPLSLAAHIEKHCKVIGPKTKKGETVLSPTKFPKEDADILIQDSHESGLPHLSGILMSPTILPGGAILATPGYDPSTCLYLDTGSTDFSSCQHLDLNRANARQAAEDAYAVLNHLISECAFENETSRSVALSAILTAIARPALPAAPLHALSAPTYGSGKSYLASIISTVATGRDPVLLNFPNDEDEFEKRLGSLLLQGAPVASIDNLNGRLESSLLGQVLTQPAVSIRILGKSKSIECPTTTFWLATGNNIAPQKDLIRRTLLCQLDPEMERPEERPFKNDPLLEITADRAKYVKAALVIMRAYQVADDETKQKIQKDAGKFNSFQHWSETVLHPLLWLGLDDPRNNRDWLEAGDIERETLTNLFSAMYEAGLLLADEYKWKTASELIETSNAHGYDDLKTGIIAALGGKTEILTAGHAVPLGKKLKQHRKRVFSCKIGDRTIKLWLEMRSGNSRRTEFRVSEKTR